MQARAADWAWVGLMLLVIMLLAISTAGLVNAAVQGDDLTLPFTSLAIGLPLNSLIAVWIGVGAWRRTVWGCRLELDEGFWPRHGVRCRPVADARAHVGADDAEIAAGS